MGAVQHVCRAKFMLTVAYNGNPVTTDISVYEIRAIILCNWFWVKILTRQNEQGSQHSQKEWYWKQGRKVIFSCVLLLASTTHPLKPNEQNKNEKATCSKYVLKKVLTKNWTKYCCNGTRVPEFLLRSIFSYFLYCNRILRHNDVSLKLSRDPSLNTATRA